MLKLFYRWARTQAVFDVALKDDAVALGESKSFVLRHKGISVGGEAGENRRVDGATVFVDDGERRPRVFGHGDTAASKDSVRRGVGDFDLEEESVADAHRFDLLLRSSVQDGYSRGWGLGRGCDADHVGIADRHHTEGDVSARSIVSTSDFVNLVRLGHDFGVSLDDNRIRVHSVLVRDFCNINIDVFPHPPPSYSYYSPLTECCNPVLPW